MHNTMHKVAPEIAGRLGVPFVHIADTTADAVREAGFTVPVFDRTRLHAERAVQLALEG